ncbi:MAG: lysine-sensitive aspartokinase 3, partial [Balneolaceae bacterium]
MIKVAKFGGTSMADVKAMRRCASIVLKDRDKRIIVVSATSGTTNMLTELTRSSREKDKSAILNKIRKKHLGIVDQLEDPGAVRPQVESLLVELEIVAGSSGRMDAEITDHILSFGELLSSVIFTRILEEEGDSAKWFDVRQVMVTDANFGNAEPDVKQIRKLAEEHLTDRIKTDRFVTQGFVGSTKDGRITTLGRGGSDFTAALLAEAVDADVLEIWTDVTAIYTTDPRMVPNARPITEITFNEAAELSVFGAKVLHPATLKPAIRKNIRVYVGSSIEPDTPGTWIVKETREYPVIRAISLRRNQTLVTVHSLEMLHRHGFLAKLFQILADHKMSVDLVTTSEVSVSLTFDTNLQGANQHILSDELIQDLQKIAEVKIETDLALIALVGNKLDATAGVSGPIFGSLDQTNIRLICHGASSHNLCFL